MEQQCILCNGTLEPWHACPDRLTNVPGEFTYCKCSQCGSLVQTPIPTQDFLNQCYANQTIGYQKPAEARTVGLMERLAIRMEHRILRLCSRFSPRMKTVDLKPSLTPPAAVLEIGCSFGERLHHLQKKGYCVTGIELSETSVAEAKRLYDLDLINTTVEDSDLPDQTYHVVIMSMALEHMRNPSDIIRKIHQLMQPGGELLISVPCADGFEIQRLQEYCYVMHAPYHIFIPSIDGLRRLTKDMFVFAEPPAFQYFHRDLVVSSAWRSRSFIDRLVGYFGKIRWLQSFIRLGLFVYTGLGGKTARVSIRLKKV